MYQPLEEEDDEVGDMTTDSRKVKLANLYLMHVLAFVSELKVRNSQGEEEEPSEHIMRFIESEGSIPETECVKFREDVVAQLPWHRMDLLYSKLQDVFELMADVEAAAVNEWFERYTVVLPLYTPKPRDDIPF